MTADEIRRRDAIQKELVRREVDARFIRAGHEPEDPNCDHKDWSGRYCLKCGTCMCDPGD